MKTKKIVNKLNLNKATISDLDKILGGSESTLKPDWYTRPCTVTACKTQCPSGNICNYC